MKLSFVLAGLFLASALLADYIGYKDRPYTGAAGTTGSEAIRYEDPAILAWASSYRALSFGPGVSSRWKDPGCALGPAGPDPFDILCLGDSGSVTLVFGRPIRNGPGFDFAVFENAFNDNFLELAWVEVSSDGIHFVRFPNYSLTGSPSAIAAAQGGSVQPSLLFGYAGKHRQGYGTPFDLEELAGAYAAALAGEDDFSGEFRDGLIAGFPKLDLGNVRYIRLVDVMGDGTALSCLGNPADPQRGLPIYDPWPTSGSPGFDLDGVAALNLADLEGAAQSIDFPPLLNQLLEDRSVLPGAASSSGLPVAYTVLDGPAMVDSSDPARLLFTGLGAVVVEANQPGDGAYAPAAPVVRSFYIADALQHIFFEPVSHKLTGSSSPIHARTSSGLVPLIEVVSGPRDVDVGFPPNQILRTGSTAGSVELRVSRGSGEAEGIHFAPAEEVRMRFEIVAPGDPRAPLSYSEWQLLKGVVGLPGTDSDFDGTADFIEFASGTDPADASDRPAVSFARAGEGFVLECDVSRRADVRTVIESTVESGEGASWKDAVPAILSIEADPSADSPVQRIRLLVEGEGLRSYWRARFEEN